MFRLASAFPQHPLPTIGPLFNEALARLLPEELSLETYNSQYLQRHSTSVPAIFAAAQVLRKLQSPPGEIETTVFTVLGPEAKLDVKVPTVCIVEYASSKSYSAERVVDHRVFDSNQVDARRGISNGMRC